MLKPEKKVTIPEMTQIVAKTAFPKGNIFIKMRNELGPIFEDEAFADLYPGLGQPAESPARLAMVTVMQFMENLTDRQAADAVRGRIDWKYALGLELSDPGFDYSVLSEFRQRLIEGEAEQILLDKILERCEAKKLLKGKKKQRSDSTHVMAAIRVLNRLELVGETMRRVLDELAREAPEWLRGHIQLGWDKRYGRRFDSYRIPKSQEKRLLLAKTIGEDGCLLLNAIFHEETPVYIRQLPMVKVMQRVWIQQYYQDDDDIHWRTKKKWGQPPAGCMIASPDDLDAHYCVRRSTVWTGYKVHLTETCRAEHPHLITHVETTTATRHDVKVTEKIQEDLADRDLLPEIHLVDEGYIEIDLLMRSQAKGIDLVGPVPSSKSWQDREEGAFDHTQFEIQWEQRRAICPGGKTSHPFSERKTWRGTPNLQISFRKQDCDPCAMRQQCTRSKRTGRTLTIYPQEKYALQQKARQRQGTEVFKELYGERAGIEGTISLGVRKMGMRRSRYIGLPRTHLQHVAIAAALNIFRLFNWLEGERPRPAPQSPFMQLAVQV